MPINRETVLRPVCKTHGGKRYLAKWIVAHFPAGYESLTYSEPMCGGASVFLNKAPSAHEVINDIDRGLVCILKALRDEPDEFVGRLRRLRYCEKTFREAAERAADPFGDYIEHALNEYVLRRMSRGGMRKAFAWSDRKRGGKPGDVNAWETMIDHLPLLAARLRDVTILNESAFDVVKVWDEPDTLTYLDPPYLPETRSDGATEVYQHELSEDDHVKLLNLARGCRGKVVISGYASPLYSLMLKDWKVRKKEVPNHSGQSKTKGRRVEVLWVNY